MAQRLAVVLSGGGAKGAFQVGVLDELMTNRGVKPAIVVGAKNFSEQYVLARLILHDESGTAFDGDDEQLRHGLESMVM